MAKGKPVHESLQPLAERTLHALMRTSAAVRQQAEERTKEYGISPAQWGILRTLNRRVEAGLEPLRMSELGSALLVRPPGLSGVVSRMEKRKLISRVADAHDRRERRIVLAQAGKDILAQALVDHARWQGNLLKGLSANEQRVLEASLNKLCVHLNGSNESNGSLDLTGESARGHRT